MPVAEWVGAGKGAGKGKGKGKGKGVEQRCLSLFVPSFGKHPTKQLLFDGPTFAREGNATYEWKLFVDWEFDTKTFYNTASVCTQVLKIHQYEPKEVPNLHNHYQEHFFDMMQESDRWSLRGQRRST